MLEYKGYVGALRVEVEDGVIAGRVLGIRDIVTFEGDNVAEATKAFRDSVDEYLAMCRRRGEEPEKPFSGKFVLRAGPDLHRRLALAAEAAGASLNGFVVGALEERLSAGAAVDRDDAPVATRNGAGSGKARRPRSSK